MEEFVNLKNITKKFPGVTALSDVSLSLYKGEVHSFVGQNGCGKSTLVKIISGVYAPESGATIEINGEQHTRLSPAQSQKYGIQIIYQDLSLFPALSVAENIAFHLMLPGGTLFKNQKKMVNRAKEVMAQINIDLDPSLNVEDLTIAQQQLVAICRALEQQARLIIMDEPTASLTSQEIRDLLKIIEDLKKSGTTIVFISHKLDEIMQVSDRTSVIRDGKLIGTYASDTLDKTRLTELMIGKSLESSLTPETTQQDKLLEISNLSVKGKFSNIDLTVYKGEIVSIVGPLGSGRTELCQTIFGMLSTDSGQIHLEDHPVRLKSNRDAIDKGIAYVSEDRMNIGLIMDYPIIENILSTILRRVKNNLGLIDKQKSESLVEQLVRDLNIKTNNIYNATNTLSGGNAQRVSIAKWVITHPKLLILDSPTVGVDVANKDEIYNIVKQLAKEGIGVLMITDEVEEAYFNSNRIIHMKNGEFIKEYSPYQSSMEEITEAVYG